MKKLRIPCSTKLNSPTISPLITTYLCQVDAVDQVKDLKNKNMKLKPIKILALVVILASISWFLYQKKTTSKSAEPAVEQLKATPTPQQTPGRPLKQNEKFIAPAGLYVTVPEGMDFRQETADDIKRTMFYIEKSDLSFQMFGVFETDNTMAEQGLEKAK